MHLKYLVATGLCLVIGMVLAAPQQVCLVPQRYKDIVVSEPYELPPEMAQGGTCLAASGGCELSLSKGYTVSVEHSVSFGFAGGLDLKEIFSLGLEAGFTTTWGTSDETVAVVNVLCDPGDYDCGMMVQRRLVKITGKVSATGACENTDPNAWFDFEVIAPFMEETNAPDSLSLSIHFGACYTECRGVDICNDLIQGGVRQCPSPLAPGQWTNHFGGEPGYISPEEAEENRERILEEQEGQS